jgi:hypothetical protein
MHRYSPSFGTAGKSVKTVMQKACQANFPERKMAPEFVVFDRLAGKALSAGSGAAQKSAVRLTNRLRHVQCAVNVRPVQPAPRNESAPLLIRSA